MGEKRKVELKDYSLFEVIRNISKDTRKSKLSILIDIIRCHKKYQTNYLDYYMFSMDKLSNEQRETIVTKGINDALILKYNSPNAPYFGNRIEFNSKFYKYLLRDWLEITNTEENYKEFTQFCKKHKEIVAKSPLIPNKVEVYKTKSMNLRDLFTKLNNDGTTLVEEVSKQCSELSKLHPDSINTIKIITLEDEIVAAYLFIGNNKNKINNLENGAMFAPINLDTGIVDYLAIDKKGNVYDKHLLSNEPILWFKIPKWPRIKRYITLVSKELEDVKYVEWNLALDYDPYIISATSKPNHYLYQLPQHCSKGQGLLPKFKNIMNKKGE